MEKRWRSRSQTRRFRPVVEPLEPKRLLATGEFLTAIANFSSFAQAGAEFGFATDSDGDHLIVGAPATDANGLPRIGAAYVFDDVTGELLLEIPNPTASTGDRFGEAVGISGDLVIVGDPRSDVGASDAGSVYVFDRQSGQLIHQLHNPSPAPFDFFGADVAIDGQTIVIGAYLDDMVTTDAGAVYIYDAVTGELQHTLSQSAGGPFSYFGASVDIHGNRLAVGVSHDDNLGQDDGKAFVFDVTNASLIYELENPTADNFDYFGQSIAISADHLVVGAHRDDLGQVSAGAAHVYDLSDGSLLHTLANPSPNLSDNFGFDVDIDGANILVGVYRDDTGARDAGIAYQFDAHSGNLLHTFTNPDPSIIDYFGHSVSISSASATVGAYWDDVAALDSGTVYRFDPMVGNALGDLFGSAPSSFDYFGQAVAAEGDNLIVGAPLDDTSGPDSGIVYVFDQWGQIKSTILNPNPDAFDQFGSALAVSGNILAVGAYADDANGILNSGSVYLFDILTGQLLHTLTSPNASANGHFGISLSIDELDLIIGAPHEDTTGPDSGMVYRFDAASATLLTQIHNPFPASFDEFGTSVSISGNQVAVGALAEVDNAANSGIAYILDVTSGDLVTTLNNPSPQANDHFGESVALFGNRVLIGAPRKDLGATDAGAAYLMDPVTGDVIREITNPLPIVGSFFGQSLDLASDAAVIGAFGSNATLLQAGGAYQFDTSTGAYRRDLLPDGLRAGDFFGFSIAVSEAFLVVGAPQADGSGADRGEVYVFDGRDAEPPVADAGGPYVADEGDSVQFDASASFDLNQTSDTLTYQWDFDYDGDNFDVDTTGINPLAPFSDDFSGTVAVRVTDDTDLSSIATTTITVNNVAPMISSDTNSLSLNEGELAIAGGTFSDLGDDVVTLSASAGTVNDLGNGTWAWEYQTTDGPDDSALVTISAQDEDGGSNQITIDLTVNNVAPVLSLNSDFVALLPGATALNSGLISDAGDDMVTLSASVGNIVDNGDGSWSWDFANVMSNDSQSVQIDATDSDNETTSMSFELLVSEVLAQSTVVVVDEGDMAFNSGIYLPPGMAETVTLSASVGTIIDNQDGTWDWDFSTLDGPDESQVVTVTADYSTGLQSTTTFDLSVVNVAPTVAVDELQITVDEGQTATNSGTYADLGQDNVTLSASIGMVVDNADGTWTWTLENVNGPTDTQVIVVTVEDEDSAVGTVSFDLNAINLPPEIDVLDADVVVDEGDPAANSGTYADLDSVTLMASIGEVTDNGDGTWAWNWTTTDGPDDSQVVTITIEDADGASEEVTFNLSVDNAAPLITIDNALVEVAENSDALNTGSFADPGMDIVTLSSSVGDIVDNGDGTWNWSLLDVTLADSQVVEITATDSDGIMHTEDFQLTVFLLSLALPVVEFPEDQIALNSGRYSEPPLGESVTLTASSGTIIDNGDGTWTWGQGDLDGPSSTQVDIDADYSNGAFATVQFLLNVTNVAPELTVQSDEIQLLQRPLIRNFGTVSDVDTDTVTLTASIGEVQDRGDGSWAWRYRPAQTSSSTEQVTITATDEDGGQSTVTFMLTVDARFTLPAHSGMPSAPSPPSRSFRRPTALTVGPDEPSRSHEIWDSVFAQSQPGGENYRSWWSSR